MPRLISVWLALGLAWLVAAAAPAHAGAKAKKRYLFQISLVSPKKTLPEELEKVVLPMLTAEVNKQLAAHPQLVTELPGAPDPLENANKYRRFLKQRGLSGAYLVRVDLTDASEEVEALEGRSKQRLIVRLAVHMFGETIPGRTMGFTGDGSASIRQGVGKKVRPRDQEYTWQSAVELAVADAISTSLAKLEASAKK
ncbi:MAG: hypothetical protein R3B48_06820 [Kofleriaceae bacterium]